jgi:Icc-related predicted phosphoesterase
MTTPGDVVRIAAVSDIHYNRNSAGALQALFAEVTEKADILVICGDMTDYGLAEEARVLAKDITTSLRIPSVGILGNHDMESNEQGEVCRILTDAGVRMLDGDAVEIHGIGFAGVRGFCGGFGRGALGAWGEPIIKAFVHETVSEALKLESALAKLRTDRRVALVHYAPIRETVEGEPLEIYPFLGSSRLEEPLTRFKVDAVFHGHAHKGALQGRTTSGIPVYNVSLPLLQERFPERQPYHLLELRRSEGVAEPERRQSAGGRRATDRV